jgi:hypothetical protein
VKRLSPNAMWWLTFASLIIVDALAAWAFSWHRPWWLDGAAGVAYTMLASAVSSHFAQPTKVRDDAPEEPS